MVDRKRTQTAIITWITYNNYGTFLQAYALQTVIRSLGFENKIISDTKYVQSAKGYSWRKCASFVIRLFSRSRKLQAKGDQNMKNAYAVFARKFLDIDWHWDSFSELDNRYNIYVCGSDQIWSPLFRQSYYYAGFTKKKKIAYAPSLGLKNCSKDWSEWVKPLLLQFSHLSVRETEGSELLSRIIDIPVPVVLDPTLLLSSENWQQLSESIPLTESSPYVLVYFLTFNPVYWAYVQNFAKEKGLPLRVFALNRAYLKGKDNISLFAGPLEFLQEIKGASYFFTDSFHGSIFAIHFEKSFCTLKRFQDTAVNNQNSRIENLFSRLDLMDYFIDENGLSQIPALPPIDYRRVKENISKERMHSLDYLKNSLEN